MLRSTSATGGVDRADAAGAQAAASSAISLKYSASCRAVGASKMRLLGSSTSAPTAACSWFCSSTAPSESSPASISGASRSTTAPVVRFTRSRTVPTLTAHRGAATGAAAFATRGATVAAREAGVCAANALRKEGAAPPSVRCQTTGNMATTAGLAI